MFHGISKEVQACGFQGSNLGGRVPREDFDCVIGDCIVAEGFAQGTAHALDSQNVTSHPRN